MKSDQKNLFLGEKLHFISYGDEKFKNAKHRIYNENLSFLKLREISNLLGISIQRISKIEKKLKVQLKKIYDVEKKQTADIV